MDDGEKLLRRWKQQAPKDGADKKEIIAAMKHLGMDVREGAKGHLVASHPALIGSALFPVGTIAVNCHAFGKAGKAHPSGVKDILRAAQIIEGETNG